MQYCLYSTISNIGIEIIQYVSFKYSCRNAIFFMKITYLYFDVLKQMFLSWGISIFSDMNVSAM